MIQVRKTTRPLPAAKTSSTAGTKPQAPASPFEISPVDPLKTLADRESQLKELQKLAILQQALGPFAEEARKHLPKPMQDVEKKMRRRMLEEGFSEPIASEAGDEAVAALLQRKPRTKK